MTSLHRSRLLWIVAIIGSLALAPTQTRAQDAAPIQDVDDDDGFDDWGLLGLLGLAGLLGRKRDDRVVDARTRT